MSFQEDYPTPKSISYLDLYVYLNPRKELQEETLEVCSSYGKDVLFGLPTLPDKVVLQTLWELGVDTKRPVEYETCLHKPLCLALSTKDENKPQVFGLIFLGSERTDSEWKREQALLKANY
jgi:hypothetical protein